MAKIWNRRIVLIGLAAVVVLLFGYFVWPTMYRYEHMNRAGSALLVRINRMNGNTAILYPNAGWVVNESAGELLPVDALSRIHANFGMVKRDYPYNTEPTKLEADVQNDSTWTLNRVVVNATFGYSGIELPSFDNSNNSTTKKSRTIEELYGKSTVTEVIKNRQYVLSRVDGTGKPGTNSRFSAEPNLSANYDLINATVTGAMGQ